MKTDVMTHSLAVGLVVLRGNVTPLIACVVLSFCRLAIQTDENDALKEALNSTLKAKEEDLKFYQEMMDQTKKIFLQGLRQFRQNSAPS